MEQLSLTNLIEKLKLSPRVRGIFATGTTAKKLTPSSDIDLVIILDKNDEAIKSVYTKIENRFSDIFFFDIDFINQLKDQQEVSGNNFDGMFLEWLMKGKIEYDPENLLLALKNRIDKNLPLQNVTDSEKRDFWIKTNYNFIANLRYYNSSDKLYQKALEIRLLYSVIELITAYFSFRGIPWRGEKVAVKYFEKHDPEFFSVFQKYTQSNNLDAKMGYYQDLFNKIFFGDYQKWDDGFVVGISKKDGYKPELTKWWEKLSGKNNMHITSTLKNRSGQILKVEYKEDDPLNELAGKILQAVHAFCFCGDKMIVVYSKEKGYWTPPGGGIEKGETIEEAVIREVKEETNMKVIHQKLIGYQDIFEPDRIVRQTRSFCITEPNGPFITDPDGDVTEIKLIDPKDYKQYFDWGEIGDRIIQRVLELKKKL